MQDWGDSLRATLRSSRGTQMSSELHPVVESPDEEEYEWYPGTDSDPGDLGEEELNSISQN